MSLPPGQRAIRGPLPRFGLDRGLRQWPLPPERPLLRVGGDVEAPLELPVAAIFERGRGDLEAGLHCVSTWSKTGLRWSGRPFADVYARAIEPRARPRAGVAHLRARGADGMSASVPLADALADAWLVDRLDGAPLTIAQGAPLRLVMPAHYGYKSVKHLTSLEITLARRRGTGDGRITHPRGRVAQEERNARGPQILWRWGLRAVLPILLARARRLDARARR